MAKRQSLPELSGWMQQMDTETMQQLGISSKGDKDAKRRFNAPQRHEILARQKMKCANCHEQLDPRFIDFHHENPWADGGETLIKNGYALCPKCHREVHHKERLKKSESMPAKKKKTGGYFEYMLSGDFLGRD
jgi:5-methylcytosine-specific restriction endonuclease McrA